LRTRKRISVNTELEKNTIKSTINVSRSLEQYFNTLNFYTIYDAEIFSDDSINNIPVLSVVLPVAWITGADVHVENIDKKFKISMDKIQRIYQKIYPKASFKTRFNAKNLIENDDSEWDRTCILFSGGVDSTFSFFQNISDEPSLIMVLGTDLPNSNPKFQEYVKRKFIKFAKREGVNIHFIKTNALEVLRQRRLDHLFMRYQGKHEGDYWTGIGYALGHISQIAPLSIRRYDRLLISAAVDLNNADPLKIPDASSPLTDEIIAWSNLRVKHDSLVSRHEKISRLKRLFENNRLHIRVCWADTEYLLKQNELNCSKCEKCLRTIASLTLEGIDPNKCGFQIDDSTFKIMKYLIEKRYLTKQHLTLWWKPIQEAIPENITQDFHGSKSFFKWFKTINLDSYAAEYKTSLLTLYTIFPYWISNPIRKIFYDSRPKMRIYEPIGLSSC